MTDLSLRILLVDDHEVVRRGVRALLETQPGLEVCGEAEDGRAAVKLAAELAPDIVVMDIGMRGLNGLEATRQIVRAHSQVEVLILSMHESEQVVREVMAAGARGYVLKTDAGRDLVSAVAALAQHETFFTSRMANQVYAQSLQPAQIPRRGRKRRLDLTVREREVLQLLAEGMLNREVASRLGISVKTAETHRARLMKKLGLESIADLVRYAVREKVVEP